MMAMDSSMHTKGMTQTADSSAPGMLGCPSEAMASTGSASTVSRARGRDQRFNMGFSSSQYKISQKKTL